MASRRDILAAAGSLFYRVRKTTPLAVPLQMMLLRSRSEAGDILSRLQSGASFEALAKQFSLAPSAASGGYIGHVDLPALAPPFRQALRGLSPGQASEIVESSSGFVILKVVAQNQQSQTQGGTAPNSMGGEGISLNYEPVTALSGLYETQRLFDRLSKPPDFEQDLQTNCQLRGQEPSGGIQEIATYVFEANHVWAQLLSFQGDMPRAIDRFREAYEIAVLRDLKGEQADLEKKLSIAYFRQAQDENWVKQHNPESSIFPLSPKAQFKVTSGSEKAIQQILPHLTRSPHDWEQR